MNQYLPITYIHAREILDSRGNPTVEAEVLLDGTRRERLSRPEHPPGVLKQWSFGTGRSVIWGLAWRKRSPM